MKAVPEASRESPDDFKFYDEYRQVLEEKLAQKVKRIQREEHLLGEHTDADGKGIQDSLRHAVHEREELESLLDEIHKQLERVGKPG